MLLLLSKLLLAFAWASYILLSTYYVACYNVYKLVVVHYHLQRYTKVCI